MVLGIEIGMKWSAEYNTGIEVIDDQHRRILDYINEIADLKYSHDRVKMKSVLDNIIDYTQSHFTFEESLQEEANYKYRVPHKRLHDLFQNKALTECVCELCVSLFMRKRNSIRSASQSLMVLSLLAVAK